MNRIAVVFVLIVVCATAAPSFAQDAPGDLQLRSLEYSAGTNRLVATIYNQAPTVVPGPILVYFYRNETKIGEVSYPDAIPRYSIVSVYIPYVLDAGMHEFRAVVDPLNSAAERSEGNNEQAVTIIHATNDSVVSVVPTAPVVIAQNPTGTSPDLMILIVLIVVGAAVLLCAFRVLRGRARARPRTHSAALHRRPSRDRDETHSSKRALEHSQDDEEHESPSVGRAATETASKQDDDIPRSVVAKQGHASHADGQKPRRVTIDQVEGLPIGTRVVFSARITYYDQIGDQHAYFLRDDHEEVVGFSPAPVTALSATITGTIDRILGDTPAIRIESVLDADHA